MATGSGLDAQLGIAAESTWGTAVTVTRFLEFNSESIRNMSEWLEPTGLRVGTKYKRTNRVRRSRLSVGGDVEMEWATLGMGLLVRHMLGSPVTAPTQIASTTAYQQHHVPGDFRGLGLTMQVGRPEPSSGTVRPFTFAGVKIPGWEFSIADNEIPTLRVDVDGRTEATATALASASYLASSVFDFSQAVLKIGGTPSTTSGVTTVAGGAAVSTIIREMSIAGEAPMDTERYGLGSPGLKGEPLENDTPTITGSLAAEFNKAELYDLYTANTATCLQLLFTGAEIEAGHNFELEFTLPSVRLKETSPTVEGPEIVQMATDYEAYKDTTNPVIQIRIKSTETTL